MRNAGVWIFAVLIATARQNPGSGLAPIDYERDVHPILVSEGVGGSRVREWAAAGSENGPYVASATARMLPSMKRLAIVNNISPI